jgi:hypothetical protein
MATVQEAPIADMRVIETRQTAAGWELLCPACQTWVNALLATAAGQMCAACWQRRSGAKGKLKGG